MISLVLVVVSGKFSPLKVVILLRSVEIVVCTELSPSAVSKTGPEVEMSGAKGRRS